ncbi:hypothetical protein 0305phi8-36p071 [Bacillus phage 0305phi8-36]|uniref:hypothetical protein n=1 Tax=Bacillus phage 0305phi8-36 TaxID=458639 RepID=UPI00015A1FA3|nr:hypothetical protein ST0305phi8-36p071 [Bacillus phage 0305phi8-36]ABS83631.1 hypothetical protein 0305phi8-36p071 [Bacillus phage 0305phi8-36]
MLTGYKDFRYGLPSGATIVQRTDLRYHKGTSDKVYIVIASKAENPHSGETTYGVTGFYGRNGANLQSTTIGEFPTKEDATKAAQKRADEKVKKGYFRLGTSYEAHSSPKDSLDTSYVQFMLNMAQSINPTTIQVSRPYTDDVVQRLIDSDTMILEPLGEAGIQYGSQTYFVMFLVNANKGTGWYVFNDNGNFILFEQEDPDDMSVAYQNQNTIYGAYIGYGSRLILHDIYYIGKTATLVGPQPWKVRRAMLSESFSSMFTKRDPYDTSFHAHLLDYVYEGKREYVDKHPDLYLLKGINENYASKPIVFQL